MTDQFNPAVGVMGCHDGKVLSRNSSNDHTATPLSDTSSEILDHDELSKTIPPCNQSHPKYVPVYLGDLGFGYLTLDDSPSYAIDSSTLGGVAGADDGSTNPHLHKNRTLSVNQGYKHTGSQSRDNPYSSPSPGSAARGYNSQRNTRTWLSPEAQATQGLMMVRNAVRRTFKNAEIAKWKIADYISHQQAMCTAASSTAALRAHQTATSPPWIAPVFTPEVQRTLRRWGLHGNFNDEVAPWPSAAELKWEGDDRAKTGVGRFPPLPREEGPQGLPWHALEVVEQYPLDQIAQIPTMEDVFLPVDEIEEDVRGKLLWKKIEDAIDEFLAS
jgi:hypothetical protein